MNDIYVFSKDKQTIELRFDSSPALAYYAQKIPSAVYDEDNRCWYIDTSYSMFVREFCDFATKRRLARSVLNMEEGDVAKTMADLMPDLQYPYQMKMDPYDYQRKGIQYMLDHKRTFNGDDMGLGKTFQSIAAVSIAKAYPCLVVCPAAMKVTWMREFMKFIGKNAMILDNSNKETWQRYFETGTCNIFITNYESVKKYFVKRMAGKRVTTKNIILDHRAAMFKSVIIDESHRCKASSTHWSKYLEKICDGKEYIFLLTGTPIVINNTDLIQQLKILQRLDDFGGIRKFRERYCSGPTGSSNMSELNYRLWKTCYFRRDKSLVLKELPEKTRQYLIVDITNRKEYDTAEKDLITYLKKYVKADDEKLHKAMVALAMVQINSLRQLTARGKMQEAIKFIRDVIDSGNKLIVFAFHKYIINEIVETFPGCVTVTGTDSQEKKQKAVDAFQNDENCKLIALNYKSGGVGITLTAASRILFIEFPWTSSDCEQSECRAHRNGQKNAVDCYYLLARNTFDERILDIIQNERRDASIVTGAPNDTEEKIIDLTLEYYKTKNKL